jgi:hypothetical protein
MNNIVGETSKQVGSFIDALKAQPLSLALVVMNFLLVAFLYYASAAVHQARTENTKMIIGWQERSDQLMASCVSADIMQMILKALDRNRDGQAGRKPAEPEPPKQPEPRP